MKSESFQCVSDSFSNCLIRIGCYEKFESAVNQPVIFEIAEIYC